MKLEGSCHCGAVRFRLRSAHPYPYQRCYCSICRKTQGGGGYAINLGGEAGSLRVSGRQHVSVYHAKLREPGGGRGEVRAVLAAAEAGQSADWTSADLAVLHDLIGDALDVRARTSDLLAHSASERNRPEEAAHLREQAASARAAAEQEYRAALALDPTDAEARQALGE